MERSQTFEDTIRKWEVCFCSQLVREAKVIQRQYHDNCIKDTQIDQAMFKKRYPTMPPPKKIPKLSVDRQPYMTRAVSRNTMFPSMVIYWYLCCSLVLGIRMLSQFL